MSRGYNQGRKSGLHKGRLPKKVRVLQPRKREPEEPDKHRWPLGKGHFIEIIQVGKNRFEVLASLGRRIKILPMSSNLIEIKVDKL